MFCAEANRSKCGLSPTMCKFHMVLNFHKAVIYVCFRLKAIASSIVLRQSFEKWWDVIWRWNSHNIWCCLMLITLSWRYQLALWDTWCNWTKGGKESMDTESHLTNRYGFSSAPCVCSISTDLHVGSLRTKSTQWSPLSADFRGKLVPTYEWITPFAVACAGGYHTFSLLLCVTHWTFCGLVYSRERKGYLWSWL